MTDTMLTASPEGVRLTSVPEGQAVFVNWPVPLNDPQVLTCDLLDGTDFSNCKLVFFDPLEFAIANGFVASDVDISEVTYVSYSESDFLRYLARVKGASVALQKFLSNGGLLVIRSNIPKSHIKVRKRSSTGTMKYTESVLSTFFWLEDILGVFSFTYCQTKTLKYRLAKSPLKKVFGKSGVHCVQTLNSISVGKLEVIATSGSSAKAPAVSKIVFDSFTGQVFLIPRFIASEEHKKLISAFEQISESRDSGTLRPRWLDYYENQVRDFSPFGPMMAEVELQIEALKKQLATLRQKQEKYDGLVDLLFESENELEAAARTAMDIIGVTCDQLIRGRKTKAFGAQPVDDKSVRLMIRVVSTNTGPVGADEVETLAEAIAASTSAIKAKGLLIGNAARYIRPEQREQWFDEGAIEASKRLDICLMPGLQLFTMVCYVMTRHDAENIEALKSSLRRDIIDCDSQFVLKRKKYAI